MNLDELNDEAAKVKIADQINSAFLTRITVNRVQQPARGVNAAGHLKVSTSDGIYGIKTWLAAKEYDGGKEGCAGRAETMNTLAKILTCPNHCDARVVWKHALPCLQDCPVIITKWMPEGKSMLELKSVNYFTATAYRKLGQWLAFGIAFDYRDWANNNIIWNERAKTLAMIDLDWSLGGGMDGTRKCVELFKDCEPSILGTFLQNKAHLNKGIRRMQKKIENRKSRVEDAIQKATGEHRNFLPIDIQDLEATELNAWPRVKNSDIVTNCRAKETIANTQDS